MFQVGPANQKKVLYGFDKILCFYTIYTIYIKTNAHCALFLISFPLCTAKTIPIQGFGTRCSAVVDCAALRVVFGVVVLRGAAIAWRWSEPVRP